MSGVAGGDRITREEFDLTLNHYRTEVLHHIKEVSSLKVAGSYFQKSKNDFGDIDIILKVDATDKKVAKTYLLEYINRNKDTFPLFRNPKYLEKRHYNAGELISLLYPVPNTGKVVQIDNIIALSEEELEFKYQFLKIPAEEQGLLLGYTKTLADEGHVLAKVGTTVDIVLSSSALTIYDIHPSGERVVQYKTSKWTELMSMLGDYPLYGTFEEILEYLKENIRHYNSFRRIVGVFKSMVSVKTGEIGTEKGLRKEQSRQRVLELLNTKSMRNIAVYGGGFKPPHKGHFHIASELLKSADSLIVFIGQKIRDGEYISPHQSQKIWEIYAKYLPGKVFVVQAVSSPVREIYDWVDVNKDHCDNIIIGTSTELLDKKKWEFYQKHREKYPNIFITEVPLKITGGEKVSAQDIRVSREYMNSLDWVPEGVDEKDKKIIMNIVGVELNEMRNINIKEEVEKGLTKVQDTYKLATEVFTEGDINEARYANSTAQKTKLVDLYQKLSTELKDTEFKLTFNQNSIIIDLDNLKNSFDYTPYMHSILEYMLEQKHMITPLPDIVIKHDLVEGNSFFGKTAFYEQEAKKITLFTVNRHPKDVMRSFVHEMIHHTQNLEGRLNLEETSDTNKSESLQKIESEAYLKGNMVFRMWEDITKRKDQ